MNLIKHPSQVISNDLVLAIRQLSNEAEQLKEMHPAQLNIIYEQKWFKIFIPKAYGGLALSLPQALHLEEATAWTDGAVGWTITLCAGAAWFAGFLHQELAAAVFDDKISCLAGSGKATGIASKSGTCYEVTGHWKYATGARVATAFTANCLVEEAGTLLKDNSGNLLVRSFLFMANEVIIHETWRTVGMISTGSHSFEVKKLTVPPNRSFIVNDVNVVLKQPIYQYPFLQLAETTLAVNSSGMALRFLELSVDYIQPGTSATSLLRRARLRMETLRKEFYTVVEDSWTKYSNNRISSSAELASVSKLSRKLALTSRAAVDKIYPFCGMQAANVDSEINRVWRNLHTASQHSLFNAEK